jgi:hypothetical protein
MLIRFQKAYSNRYMHLHINPVPTYKTNSEFTLFQSIPVDNWIIWLTTNMKSNSFWNHILKQVKTRTDIWKHKTTYHTPTSDFLTSWVRIYSEKSTNAIKWRRKFSIKDNTYSWYLSYPMINAQLQVTRTPQFYGYFFIFFGFLFLQLGNNFLRHVIYSIPSFS